MARNAATPARPRHWVAQRGVGQRCAGQDKVHLPAAPAGAPAALVARTPANPRRDAGISAHLRRARPIVDIAVNSFSFLRNLSAKVRKTTRSKWHQRCFSAVSAAHSGGISSQVSGHVENPNGNVPDQGIGARQPSRPKRFVASRHSHVGSLCSTSSGRSTSNKTSS